jgi:hypothetical protein
MVVAAGAIPSYINLLAYELHTRPAALQTVQTAIYQMLIC